jgi:hypothetical protein
MREGEGDKKYFQKLRLAAAGASQLRATGIVLKWLEGRYPGVTFTLEPSAELEAQPDFPAEAAGCLLSYAVAKTDPQPRSALGRLTRMLSPLESIAQANAEKTYSELFRAATAARLRELKRKPADLEYVFSLPRDVDATCPRPVEARLAALESELGKLRQEHPEAYVMIAPLADTARPLNTDGARVYQVTYIGHPGPAKRRQVEDLTALAFSQVGIAAQKGSQQEQHLEISAPPVFVAGVNGLSKLLEDAQGQILAALRAQHPHCYIQLGPCEKPGENGEQVLYEATFNPDRQVWQERMANELVGQALLQADDLRTWALSTTSEEGRFPFCFPRSLFAGAEKPQELLESARGLIALALRRSLPRTPQPVQQMLIKRTARWTEEFVELELIASKQEQPFQPEEAADRTELGHPGHQPPSVPLPAAQSIFMSGRVLPPWQPE